MYSMQVKILGLTCRIEIIIISIVVGMILGAHLLCSCSKVTVDQAKKKIKEGFHMLHPAGLGYQMGRGVKSSYVTRHLPSIAQDLSTHIGPKVPLPPGEMFFFYNTQHSCL